MEAVVTSVGQLVITHLRSSPAQPSLNDFACGVSGDCDNRSCHCQL